MTAFGMDGNALLRQLVAESSYGSLSQAVGSLTLFAAPETVAQTGGRNLFRLARAASSKERGDTVVAADGIPAMLDDNTGPTDAFLWANALPHYSYHDVQFNRLRPIRREASGHVVTYTALLNLCVTPAFLAKLTDTDPEIGALLRYRAFELYGVRGDREVPPRPEGYSKRHWSAPPPPMRDVEGRIRRQVQTKPKSRTTRSAREIGWLFSGVAPDRTLLDA